MGQTERLVGTGSDPQKTEILRPKIDIKEEIPESVFYKLRDVFIPIALLRYKIKSKKHTTPMDDLPTMLPDVTSYFQTKYPTHTDLRVVILPYVISAAEAFWIMEPDKALSPSLSKSLRYRDALQKELKFKDTEEMKKKLCEFLSPPEGIQESLYESDQEKKPELSEEKISVTSLSEPIATYLHAVDHIRGEPTGKAKSSIRLLQALRDDLNISSEELFQSVYGRKPTDARDANKLSALVVSMKKVGKLPQWFTLSQRKPE